MKPPPPLFFLGEEEMLTDALIMVRELCARLGFSFTLTWSEAEGLWYADASGQGKLEYFEIKRASTSEIALERLAEKLSVFEAGVLETRKNAAS